MMIQMGGHAIFCNNTHVVNKRTIRIHVKACPEEAYAAAGTSKKFMNTWSYLLLRKEGKMENTEWAGYCSLSCPIPVRR